MSRCSCCGFAAATPDLAVQNLNQAYLAFDDARRKERYPSPDPAASLLSVRPYVTIQKYKEAMDCVTNVGTYIADGDDPYLDVLRADVLISWNEAPGSEIQSVRRKLEAVRGSRDIVAAIRATAALYALDSIKKPRTVDVQNPQTPPQNAGSPNSIQSPLGSEPSPERRALLDLMERVKSRWGSTLKTRQSPCRASYGSLRREEHIFDHTHIIAIGNSMHVDLRLESSGHQAIPISVNERRSGEMSGDQCSLGNVDTDA